MANSLIMSYGGSRGNSQDTNQDFYPIVQMTVDQALLGRDEASTQVAFLAGTASKLWVRVITAATATSTMVLRKNKANGNMSVSITANQTGAFSDAVNTDVINNGDLVCYGITAGSTALVVSILAFTFAATVDTNTKLGVFSNIGNFGSGTSTDYIIPSGFTSYNSSEAVTKLRMRKAMTVKNLSFMWMGSSGTTATMTSRKNGASGNLTLTINSSTEKLYQDTTHSDSLVLGDDFDYQFVVTSNGSDSGSIIGAIAADFVSSNGDCIFVCGDDGLPSISTSLTDYYGLSGSLDTAQTSETKAQVTVNSIFIFSQLTCNVTSNGITNASTINLRVNGGNAGPTLSIQNQQTGIFNDSSNTYTAAATDAMNYQVVTAATGSTLNLEFIAVWGNAKAVAPAAGPSYIHFDNTIKYKRQNYNSFRNQMIIFG